MRFFAPIRKVDGEQRMVFGYASTQAEDAEGETILISALAGALDDYMQFANIREMHQLSAVGVAKDAAIDDKGLYIGAKIVDDAAWNKLVEGDYKGFSVGGRALARDPGNRKIITEMKLSEISLVDRPCNPEAVFDCWKAADFSGDTDLPENTAAAADALIADFIAGREIKMDVTKAGNAPDTPVDGTNATVPKDGVVEPGASGETTVGKPVDGKHPPVTNGEVPKAPDAPSGEATVEKPVDGKRPTEIVPDGDGDEVQIVNPDGEKVEIDHEIDKIDAAGEDDPVVKRKFNAKERREAAKSGAAMKDGSYPIEDADDLENAIRAIGRAKDRNAVIRHIKRRAKALDLESKLPPWLGGPKDEKKAEMAEPVQVWSCGDPAHQHIAKAEAAVCIRDREALAKAAEAVKPAAEAVAALASAVGGALAKAGKSAEEIAKAQTGTLRKGLYTLSDLASMVLQLRSMVCSVDYEETSERDADSQLPQLMRDALKALVDAFRAMSDEETEELMESVATNTAEPNTAASFLYMAAHIGDLAKAGARHSKADRAQIQAAHDILKGLGAECTPEDDDAADKVAKALGERDATISELKKALDQVTPLAKAVTTLGETIDELRKTTDAQAEEIRVLKAQPMPPKTAANLFAIAKEGDGVAADSDEQLLKRLTEMTEEDRTLLLVKAARRNPVAPSFAAPKAA